MKLKVVAMNLVYCALMAFLVFWSETKWAFTWFCYVFSLAIVTAGFLWFCYAEARVAWVRLTLRWRAYRLTRTARTLADGLAEVFGDEAAVTFMAGVVMERDPMAEHFEGLVVRESYLRGKAVKGWFDSGGHFVMEEIGDDVDLSVLIGEIEHPAPDTVDDLDNTWEPES